MQIHDNSRSGTLRFSHRQLYDAIVRKNGVSKTLPGLKNFYMVGQWAGGTIELNTECLLGRNLVRTLCKKDSRKFKTGISE